ncbi:MAG: oxygenase MpaB family protein [Actinomycetota bacterium]|nr:oxygenase MpaB family protein [Actinomycetota bacterium]
MASICKNRFDNLNKIQSFDPTTQYREIYKLMTTYEFPWDMNQALSFALFRTYAVPTIGSLLAHTGELLGRVQKRYDDTVVVLDAILENGPNEGDGLAALRRMNQMHNAYNISNDDMLYVLSTFVVTPIRWMDDYGWRPMSENEKVAAANYYRDLGRRMGIREIPESWQSFTEFLDGYENAKFAFDKGGADVASSTIELFTTFPPNQLLPKSLVYKMSYALMDEPLLNAFGFPSPNPTFKALVRWGLKLRGKVVEQLPPRKTPKWPREMPQVRSYPKGYDIEKVGTFPPHQSSSPEPN